MKIYERDYTRLTEREITEYEEVKQKEIRFVSRDKGLFVRKGMFSNTPKRLGII